MKKIYYKPLLVSIGLIVLQSILFALSKLLGGEPNLIGNIIDDKIAFNIWAIIPYCSWYFLLFIVPYILYIKNKNQFAKYCISFIIVTIVANIIFIIYPTTVARPIIKGNNILELITRFIFWIDTPVQNCFPSLHCAMSMLYILYMLNNKKTNIYEKTIIPILSIIIMISTLIIKQHVFIDLVCGNVIALVVYLIVYNDNKLTNKFKELLKI